MFLLLITTSKVLGVFKNKKNAKLPNDVKFESNIFRNIASRLLPSDRPPKKVGSVNSPSPAKSNEGSYLYRNMCCVNSARRRVNLNPVPLGGQCKT